MGNISSEERYERYIRTVRTNLFLKDMHLQSIEEFKDTLMDSIYKSQCFFSGVKGAERKQLLNGITDITIDIAPSPVENYSPHIWIRVWNGIYWKSAITELFSESGISKSEHGYSYDISIPPIYYPSLYVMLFNKFAYTNTFHLQNRKQTMGGNFFSSYQRKKVINSYKRPIQNFVEQHQNKVLDKNIFHPEKSFAASYPKYEYMVFNSPPREEGLGIMFYTIKNKEKAVLHKMQNEHTGLIDLGDIRKGIIPDIVHNYSRLYSLILGD